MIVFLTYLTTLLWIFMTSSEQKLITIFTEISNTEVAVNAQTNLNELDLDSMDTLDVLMRIENELNVEVKIEKFATCTDIASLDKLVNGH